MSSDGKIYITISDARTGEIIKDTDKILPKGKGQLSAENTFGEFARHQFFNLIEKEAKQMVNYTIGNIGNFTGDYNAQRQVNYAKSVTSSAMSILGGAAVGSQFGVPGAIIGAYSVIMAQAANFGLQLHSENIAIRKQNYNISQLRQLSGLDGLTNGSRI